MYNKIYIYIKIQIEYIFLKPWIEISIFFNLYFISKFTYMFTLYTQNKQHKV